MNDHKTRCQFYTQREICSLLGISANTFRREKIGEQLDAYKVGKRVKYRVESVNSLMLERGQSWRRK